MKNMEKLWYQTRDGKYTIKEKIRIFLWIVRHPFLTVKLADYALKRLIVSGVDIKEDVLKRN